MSSRVGFLVHGICRGEPDKKLFLRPEVFGLWNGRQKGYNRVIIICVPVWSHGAHRWNVTRIKLFVRAEKEKFIRRFVINDDIYDIKSISTIQAPRGSAGNSILARYHLECGKGFGRKSWRNKVKDAVASFWKYL